MPSGNAVNLTVADDNALANANLSLSGLLGALNNAGVGTTPDGALNATTTLDAVLAAASVQANTQGNAAAAAALNKLRSQTTSVNTQSIKLADLINVDTRQGPLANNQINALDLVTGSASTFNSKNVAAVRNVTVNGSDLGITSASTLDISMVVVEPALFVCGPVGTQFYSASVRIRVHLNLNSVGLNLTALAPLATVRINLTQLDIVAAVGRASGTITAINAAMGTLTVQATPGIAELYLGTIPNANFVDRTTPLSQSQLTPAQIGNVVVTAAGTSTTATISARSYALGTTPTAKTLTFAGPYAQTQTANVSVFAVGVVPRA